MKKIILGYLLIVLTNLCAISNSREEAQFWETPDADRCLKSGFDSQPSHTVLPIMKAN
jgi:hypothetical protein